ncbi:hypothetical protein pdam_00010996 [Pocillopora damicornis]|uniref:tRNA (N(6)-L-threonylcarbamoyladenosine(37)-C(2))-methylthiotransferase n=1 Tax=Pocillopora damicornis TaxID=46731 RepID=A0A3M6U4A1_POCDA|nr:hypothetical protein pdam_00010996 [Pocillopora damicornis]
MPSCDLDVCDIEDAVKKDDLTPNDRITPRGAVLPKARVKSTRNNLNELPVGDSIIPGTQKIYVRTWGCSHNNSDGEYMAGQLAAYGYKITDDSEAADLWLLNSCTVKNPSEDNFRNAIKRAQELDKHLVVAGCVPQGQPKHQSIKGISVIGVQQIDRVVEVVEETLKGHTVRLLGQKKVGGKKTGGAPLDLPKIRKNPLIEIIAINTGCLNQCTYCKTKHARGDLGSYPPEEIVERAKQAFEEGVVELWLTSEDTGAYGKDIGVTLPELLWQLVEVIPEGAMLRIGMTNPPYILEHLETGQGQFQAQKSVSSELKLLNPIFRVPGVTIATDVICGFPTETWEDFQETVALVDQYKFPSLFINQFYPRPGTPAARMKRLPTEEVKKRTREISKVFHSYHPYDHKVGEHQTVLITEDAKDQAHFVGHNKYYDQVLIHKSEGDLMGKMVQVEITSAGEHFQMARVLRHTKVHSPGLVEPLPKGAVSGVRTTLTPERVVQGQASRWQQWQRAAVVVLLAVVVADVLRILYLWTSQ